MKERIIAALKTKFEGISDYIINRVADKLTEKATSEEQADELVKNYTLSMLVEGEADRRANEAQQSAVKNYETKYGLKNGKSVANDTQTGLNTKQQNGKDDMPEWAKEIVEQNKLLRDNLENISKAHITEGRKAKLSNVIKQLPQSLQKGYERISLEGTDEEFNTLLGDITSEVSTILQDTKQRGAVFNRPKVGGSADTSKLTEEQMKAITSRGNKAADAQPF